MEAFWLPKIEQSRRWALSMLSHPKVGGHKGQRRLRSQACPVTQELWAKGHLPRSYAEPGWWEQAKAKWSFELQGRDQPWPLVLLQK